MAVAEALEERAEVVTLGVVKEGGKGVAAMMRLLVIFQHCLDMYVSTAFVPLMLLQLETSAAA